MRQTRKQKLYWVTQLSRATTEDAKKIAELHIEIFGTGLHICTTCPDSIRNAVKRLTKKYEQDYD